MKKVKLFLDFRNLERCGAGNFPEANIEPEADSDGEMNRETGNPPYLKCGDCGDAIGIDAKRLESDVKITKEHIG